MIAAKGIGRLGLGGRWLWRNLDLTLQGGQIVGLLGRNGTGKTTLIRTLLGLVNPHEGAVTTCGTTGYVPQYSQIAFPFAVRQVVAMGRAGAIRLFSNMKRTDHEIVLEAMERVGVAHLAERSFFHISGGERQLVLIARAIASGCETLLLDEPFSSLDLDKQVRTLRLLYDLAERSKIGIMFSTHQPDHLLAGRCSVLVLNNDTPHAMHWASEKVNGATLSETYGTEVDVIHVDRDRTHSRHAVVNFSVRR